MGSKSVRTKGLDAACGATSNAGRTAPWPNCNASSLLLSPMLAHPELLEALTFALRYVATADADVCANPVRVLAEQLIVFDERRRIACDVPGLPLSLGNATTECLYDSNIEPTVSHGACVAVAAGASEALGCALPTQLTLPRARRASVFAEPLR